MINCDDDDDGGDGDDDDDGDGDGDGDDDADAAAAIITMIQPETCWIGCLPSDKHASGTLVEGQFHGNFHNFRVTWRWWNSCGNHPYRPHDA